MSKKTGGPAFPVPMFAIGQAKYSSNEEGMTLRDYFAAKAMQAIMRNFQGCGDQLSIKELAEMAYQMADAMIAERNK